MKSWKIFADIVAPLLSLWQQQKQKCRVSYLLTVHETFTVTLSGPTSILIIFFLFSIFFLIALMGTFSLPTESSSSSPLYLRALASISKIAGQQGTMKGPFKIWSPLTHMPLSTILGWPTAAGLGYPLFGTLPREFAFTVCQEYKRWVHWQGSIRKAERSLPSQETVYLFIYLFIYLFMVEICICLWQFRSNLQLVSLI